MITIFRNVIKNGDYDLAALLAKIDKYHVEGKLTDAEREALYTEARKEPAANYNYDAEIEAIWKAIRELQKVEPDETAKEYKQPTGAHDAYNKGDKVIYNGAVYECLIDNCVWNPDTLPSAWAVSA